MSQEIDYQAEIEKCNTMEDITDPDGLYIESDKGCSETGTP